MIHRQFGVIVEMVYQITIVNIISIIVLILWVVGHASSVHIFFTSVVSRKRCVVKVKNTLGRLSGEQQVEFHVVALFVDEVIVTGIASSSIDSPVFAQIGMCQRKEAHCSVNMKFHLIVIIDLKFTQNGPPLRSQRSRDFNAFTINSLLLFFCRVYSLLFINSL